MRDKGKMKNKRKTRKKEGAARKNKEKTGGHKIGSEKKFRGICLAKEFHKSKKEFCLKNI